MRVPPNAARRRRTTWKRPDLLTMTCCEPEMMLNFDGAAAFLSSSPMVGGARAAAGVRQSCQGFIVPAAHARQISGLPELFGCRNNCPALRASLGLASPAGVGQIYNFLAVQNTWNCGNCERKAAAVKSLPDSCRVPVTPNWCHTARNGSARLAAGAVIKASPKG